ncbi:hypothetical protein H634G_09621 [Metarhizium anisopliae BRIP 53293]|uniref:Alcohol dehydrogenase-like N-terminal domain-containing protein n=1 Tax=Metarhizium anisopliae BRIP 53293 TaxID=1291518 RepID=A0A0D9NM48_METAN|nr:hypothetical protein H634G_09621 [Metarhizium anisopliae BRIP 53293]
MGYPDTFQGFCVDGPTTWNTFHKSELKPKPFGDHDVDVEIAACSICSSDLHTVTGGWGDYKGPLCVGHEVVGKAVQVGQHVKHLKVGDRVGVGAQVWACLECHLCKDKNENYCPKLVDTYNAQYPDGSWAHGGLASHIRAHEYFTFKIPSALDTNVAAPLLCAGITTFDMAAYLSILKPGADFHMVGLPDKALPEMTAGLFAAGAPKLTGSHLGNHQEMDALLKLAAEKGVKPWVELMPISEKNCGEAFQGQKDNKFRYRCTLTDFDKAFSKA